ncbi:hypothetical protein CUN60_06110 [Aquella oligotrophica]|uniref:Uncharacterized protein n=2 Tax=Aquella oligotrophica TaxID=2067065 RepID=A0A2I7N5Y7_9NEIS|nr:hypothetical protein CUN60_06110 [Aquella oligotrophica]
MVLFVLNSCGGNTSIANNAGGDGTITSSYMIRADQISPTPIVNGKPTKFYIYFHNYSITKVNGLTWSLVTDTSQNETLATKMTSWFSSFMSKNTSNQEMKKSIAPVSIVDASACTSIESASDCRILLSANEVGSGILQGRTESGIVVTSEIPSSYPYITTDDNGNNSLVLSPVSTSVVLDNGLAASSFSVINNSNSLIEVTNLLNSLPAGVSWQLTNCENPLPSNGVCQVRINYTNNTPEIITNTQVNIKLSGNKVNQDGSLEALGNQYSSATINVMTAKVANLQAGYSGLVLDGDNQAKGNSTIAYIKNYGTASASIGNLSIVNSLFTLSDDNCSNHSLNPQEICSYKITANVSGISQAGHITITVPYNNGISSLQTSAILNYDYKKSTNLPVAAAAISLSATNALTQNAPNGIVTVKNTGNVPLAGLTVPIMTPQNPRVVISDPNGCVNNDLLVGASCNFLLAYTPVAPSEDTSIIFGGVSAYYNNQSVSFATTVGTNVSSIFAGHLIISEARLTDSATTKMLTVTNDGNADASISNITISSGNVNLLGAAVIHQ